MKDVNILAASILTLLSTSLSGCILAGEGTGPYGGSNWNDPYSEAGAPTTQTYSPAPARPNAEQPQSNFTGFDPFAPEVSLAGSWALNFGDGEGDRVPNAVSCFAAGIDTVQLMIYEDQGGAFVAPAALRFSCEESEFVVPALLGRGYYYYRWSAIDAKGQEVAASDYFDLDATYRDTIDTVKAVFLVDAPLATSASVELYWDTLRGLDFATGTCDSAGVFGGMQYTLIDPWGVEVATDDVTCANRIEFQNLSWGRYQLLISGYEAASDPTAYWVGACSFYVDTQGDSFVECDVLDDVY